MRTGDTRNVHTAVCANETGDVGANGTRTLGTSRCTVSSRSAPLGGDQYRGRAIGQPLGRSRLAVRGTTCRLEDEDVLRPDPRVKGSRPHSGKRRPGEREPGLGSDALQ